MVVAKKPRLTRKQLKQKIIELEAQNAAALHFALCYLPKAGPTLLGSGVIVDLKFLGGKEVCSPFAIRDGFSQATLDALSEDIRRSYGIATMYKPAGYKEDVHGYLATQTKDGTGK